MSSENPQEEDDLVPIMVEEENPPTSQQSNPKNDTQDTEDTFLISIEGIGGSFLCHPQKIAHKGIALFLMCLLGFGSYYCYDNPAALQDKLTQSTLKLTTFQFASLYSWYSWPNVILPIIGGYLIDTVFGIRLGAVIFAAFIMVGQWVFAMGAFYDSFGIMEAGRFVFGIGGESLAVAQNTYAASWFSGNTLNMVFGFQLSTARLGSSVNYWTVGHLYDLLLPEFTKSYTALGWTLLIASGTCIMSFVSAIILGILDKRACRILEKDTIEQDKIKLKDILSFKLNFWLLSLVCVTYYVAVFPFISLGQVFFIKKYGYTDHEANSVTSLVYLISAFASPLLGLMIDKIGRNISFVFVSITLTLISHMMLGFTFWNPYVPIVLMGCSYSLLASALWPICTLLVPEHQLGTAFGIMQAVQNLGLAVVPLMAGLIIESYGYIWLEIFFILWLSISVVTTLVMGVIDQYYNDGYLNMNIRDRKVYREIVKKTEDDKQD